MLLFVKWVILHPPPPPLEQKLFHNWFVMSPLDTETSSMRTLKIMPRNLSEIVPSWIRLLALLLVFFLTSPNHPLLASAYRPFMFTLKVNLKLPLLASPKQLKLAFSCHLFLAFSRWFWASSLAFYHGSPYRISSWLPKAFYHDLPNPSDSITLASLYSHPGFFSSCAISIWFWLFSLALYCILCFLFFHGHLSCCFPFYVHMIPDINHYKNRLYNRVQWFRIFFKWVALIKLLKSLHPTVQCT